MQSVRAATRRVFRVGDVTIDEVLQDLEIGGRRLPVERKPFAVLLALLRQPDRPVSSHDLLIAGWGNPDPKNEPSLANAISKLRAALGPQGHRIIRLVPGAGYQVGLPVETWSTIDAPRLELGLAAGKPVPLRPHWRLQAPLDRAARVWRASHPGMAEHWVFSFADTAELSSSLQEQVGRFQRLRDMLGDGPGDGERVQIVDCNFDALPHFIARPFAGRCLAEFAEGGALAALAPEARIALAAEIARLVARAHAVGVLHGAVRPTNVLLDETAPTPRPRLIGFGAAAPAADFYTAPELAERPASTAAADAYSVGVLLFQLARGTLDGTMTARLEDGIAEPLLRQDIAAATARDPARRVDAAGLARQLEQLPQRRAAAARERAEQARAADALRVAERVRARRPFVLAALASLVLGSAAAVGFGLRAAAERDSAQRQARQVKAIDVFLTEDVLGRADPARSGRSDETLTDAAINAEASIQTRFAAEPLIAASVYSALARGFDRRSIYQAARLAYDNAARAFERAEGPGSADAAISRLQHAAMEAVADERGSLERADVLVAEAAARLPGLGRRRREAEVWFDDARGALGIVRGDAVSARADFVSAADLADTMPASFDDDMRFRLRQREAFADMRLGRWDDATAVLDATLPRARGELGPRHPDVLQAELTLAQVQVEQGRPAAAVASLAAFRQQILDVFGPRHHLSIMMASIEAQALGQLGRYADSIRDETLAHDAASAEQGAHSFMAIGTLADLAETRCRAGDAAGGATEAAQSHEDALAAFGATHALTQVMRGTLAFCLIVGGRDGEALPLLIGIDRNAAAQLTADPHYGDELDLMLAQIAADGTDLPRAATLLKGPIAAFTKPDADPYMRDWTGRLRHQLKVDGAARP